MSLYWKTMSINEDIFNLYNDTVRKYEIPQRHKWSRKFDFPKLGQGIHYNAIDITDDRF